MLENLTDSAAILKRLYPIGGPTLDSLRMMLEIHDAHPPRIHDAHSLYRARDCPPEGEVEYPQEEYERIYLEEATEWVKRRSEIRRAIASMGASNV